MKTQFLRLLSSGLLLALPSLLFAQIGFNSPAGITPKQDVEMYSRNSFLWQQKYRVTTDPSSGIYTMSCPTSTTLTATAGILLDPGGTSSYPGSQTCVQVLDTPGGSLSVGYEITFEQFGMAVGDSVFFEDTNSGRIGFSGASLPPTLLIPGRRLTVRFKSNGDFFTAAGFRFRWRRVYSLTGDPFGYSLQYDATKGTLIAGVHGVGTAEQAGEGSSIFGSENSVTGREAAAFGSRNKVAGTYAVAFGALNESREAYSMTVGLYNVSSGYSAMAVGIFNEVLGNYAAAIGSSNLASGFSSIALGRDNIATGDHTTALGTYASTNNFKGAFVVGDASTFTSTSATADNQYTARFAGGYRLFSNSATTIGVQLVAGGNAWSAISDSTKKERFLPLNHADLLANIRTLRLGTWNYKGQRTERHYGPMAQDFFARFGHDALGNIGCDTLLNSHDFTAVTLSGVQALALENEQLKAKLAQAESRLEALERAVFLRSAPRTSSRLRRKQERP